MGFGFGFGRRFGFGFGFGLVRCAAARRVLALTLALTLALPLALTLALTLTRLDRAVGRFLIEALRRADESQRRAVA